MVAPPGARLRRAGGRQDFGSRRDEAAPPEAGAPSRAVNDGRGSAMGPMGRKRGVTPKSKVLIGLGLGAMLATFLSPAASSGEALDRAISLASEQRYGQARAVLDPVLERDADHPLGRLLDGVLRAHEGRVGEAIEIFERLRRDHPDLSEPWNNLAVLYAAEGRFDEARETLLTALEHRPSAIGYANLGDIYSTLARHAYGRARELGPDVSGDPATAEESGLGLAMSAVPAAAAPADPLPVEPARAAEPPGAPTRSHERPGACLRAGGFEDRRDISGAQEWLESNGAEVVELRRVRHREVTRHQVYLPPLENRAKATDKVRKIRARGVRDVAVIPKGPLANGVSLGVFRVTGNRDRRVAALERLGYRPLSRVHLEIVHRFYLESRTAEDPEGIRAAWAERFPEHLLEHVDCR